MKVTPLPPAPELYPMESVSAMAGFTSFTVMPSTSATCIAMAARLPPMSGEPSIRLTVPSGLTDATAVAGPLPLNHAPPATPRPRSPLPTGLLRCGCSRAASSISWFPIRRNLGPAICRVPSFEVFSRRSLIGSISRRRARSSMTCSAANAAAGEPGAR